MTVQTVLMQRSQTRKITKQDFTEAGIGLYGTVYAFDDEIVQMWNDHIPYTPSEISLLFSDLYVTGLTLTLRCNQHNSIDFVFHCPQFDLDEDEKNFGNTSRTFQYQRYGLPTTDILESYTQIHPQHQGKGLGTVLNDRFTDLDIALGVRRISFTAGMDNGGHAWAKAGYYVDGLQSVRTRSLSRQLETDLKCLSGILPVPLREAAQPLALIAQHDALFHLAHLDDDLTDLIQPEDLDLGADLYCGFFPHYSFHEKGGAQGAAQEMKKVVMFCRSRGKPLTLGKLLLNGKTWDAFANYDDPVQLQRMQENGLNLRFSQQSISTQAPSRADQTQPSIAASLQP